MTTTITSSYLLLLCSLLSSVAAWSQHSFVSHPTAKRAHRRRSKPLASLQSSRLPPDQEDDDSKFLSTELQKRMQEQMNQYYNLLSSDTTTSSVDPEMAVHIVVFNPGSDDPDAQQGVHTIEFPKGSGNNVILAFESGDECVEFAQMLKEMEFYQPVPQTTQLDQLETFCRGLNVPVKVVPEGWQLRPPSETAEDLSMNPNLGKDKDTLNRIFGIGGQSKGGTSSEDDNRLGQWD